jgi:hypothetical protein
MVHSLNAWVRTRAASVILSAAKDLALGSQMLRGVSPERSAWAQGDMV